MDRSTGTPLGFALLLFFAVAFGWVWFGAPAHDGTSAALASYNSLTPAERQARAAQPPLVWPQGLPGALSDPNYAGRSVVANGLRVTGVDAAEGFWVEKDGRRAWIQLAEPDTVLGGRPPESPYKVRAGDVVNVKGIVQPHDPGYPSRIYFCTEVSPSFQGSYDRLAAAGAHLSVAVDNLTFGNRPFPEN